MSHQYDYIIVGAGSAAYEPILVAVLALNAAIWWRSLRSA